MRNLTRLCRPLLFLGTTYILVAFGRDFVLGAIAQNIRYRGYAAEYLPFALLSLIAIPLRIAAFLRLRFGLRSDQLPTELDREPAQHAVDDDRGADIFRTV